MTPSAAALLATLAAALVTSPAAARGDDPDWLIVRGDAELVAPMTYAKIGSVYLSSYTTRIVHAVDADARPAASRVVVGTPGDHALVADLAAAFGLRFSAGRAQFQDRSYERGTGFVLVADDPDGGGLMTLIVGADPESLLACFTVSHDITQPGYAVMQRQKKLATGPLLVGVDLTRPLVIRLDRDVDRLLAETEGWPGGDRTLRVARGIAGFGHVFQALVGRSDTLPSVQALAIDAQGLARKARAAFAGRDPDAEVLLAYERCRDALAGTDAPAPVVYVVNDPSAATNGKNFGADPLTGRPQVVLNLAPLARDRNFDAVCIHECLHTFQGVGGTRAVDRGMREGTATLGTQLVDPSVTDAEALLWSDAELAAAEARRAELVGDFKLMAESTEPATLNGWFTLGAKHNAVPGAPSRSGYYVCWLACKAWMEQHRGSTLADLFAASADELLAALQR